MTKERAVIFPDDDGEKTMAWVTKPRERERIGCERVVAVLNERPWVKGEVVMTVPNGPDDVLGIDMFVPVDENLFEVLGVCSFDGFLPVQVKSSRKGIRDFLKSRGMVNRGKLVLVEGNYTIAVNGTDAKLLILADMVGQMIVLAKDGGMSESEFLAYLNQWMNDREAVETWYDQRDLMLEMAWYKDLL